MLARLPRLQEISAMSRLAVPVVLAQVGLMLMGVVDTLMVSRVSAEALAAVALGNLYFTSLMLPAAGTLMVLDAVVSQAMGAADHGAAARGVQRGFVMAAGIALVMSAVLLPATPVMTIGLALKICSPRAIALRASSTESCPLIDAHAPKIVKRKPNTAGLGDAGIEFFRLNHVAGLAPTGENPLGLGVIVAPCQQQVEQEARQRQLKRIAILRCGHGEGAPIEINELPAQSGNL